MAGHVDELLEEDGSRRLWAPIVALCETAAGAKRLQSVILPDNLLDALVEVDAGTRGPWELGRPVHLAGAHYRSMAEDPGSHATLLHLIQAYARMALDPAFPDFIARFVEAFALDQHDAAAASPLAVDIASLYADVAGVSGQYHFEAKRVLTRAGASKFDDVLDVYGDLSPLEGVDDRDDEHAIPALLGVATALIERRYFPWLAVVGELLHTCGRLSAVPRGPPGRIVRQISDALAELFPQHVHLLRDDFVFLRNGLAHNDYTYDFAVDKFVVRGRGSTTSSRGQLLFDRDRAVDTLNDVAALCMPGGAIDCSYDIVMYRVLLDFVPKISAGLSKALAEQRPRLEAAVHAPTEAIRALTDSSGPDPEGDS